MYANHMRRLREERGISPAEMAVRIGRSVATVMRYERGETEVDLPMARVIARAFDSTVDDVFPDTQTRELA
jgi:DNA-binding XRE family transcriptional regulator